MSKLSKLFDLSTKPDLIKALLSQAYSGYLVESGWIKSFEQKSPVDKDGNPLPWITLPCIDFLAGRINKNITIFEFGSGNSTLYFAQHVHKVMSVEHDNDWHQKISLHAPSNVEVFLCPLVYDADYCRFANTLIDKFELIVVDGRDRVNCVKHSVDALSEDGCIILDDSERPQYQEAHEFLQKHHFRQIDFWGMAPGLSYKKCTTIFYKTSNFLNI